MIGPLTRRSFGLIGTMAPRDISRSLSRTSVTIAALMLAVTVIIGVTIMVDSFRHTVSDWLDEILVADIYISPIGQGLRLGGEIDPTFIEAMTDYPQVAHVGLMRGTAVPDAEGRPVEIRASNPQPGQAERQFIWGIGDGQAIMAALDRGAVTVSEVYARRVGLPVDGPSTVALLTETGLHTFEVVGVFYDYSLPEKGYVALRLETYRQLWPSDERITNVGLYLTPQAEPQADQITRQLIDQFGAEHRLAISSNRGIKQNALIVFDRTFTITTALQLLATLVAFIGVLSALMSLQLERTRELGTLRANGMSMRQLWAKTLLETSLMGLTAGLIALPVGWMLAFILIRFINLRSFGWTLGMQTDLTIFGLALGVAWLAALLATIYPVARLNGMQIATAVRQE